MNFLNDLSAIYSRIGKYKKVTWNDIRYSHIKLISFLFLVMPGMKSFEQTPQKPFPQHINYTAGTIKPSNYSQLQLDNSVKAFYDQWKVVYLRDNCGADKYYVWFDEESQNNSICVSEGQGYGMLITAYMAGYDPDAKVLFDGLYNYYKAHPSINNSHLMAWNQVTGCVNDPDGGNNSATDGDMDIAFSLLLADKQWGSDGNINYLEEALAIINAIKQNDANQALWIPLLGDWVTPGSDEYDDTRPSDFMPDHFRPYQSAATDVSWDNIVNKCYDLVNAIQSYYSQNTGLLPDFIVDISTSFHPASPNYLEGDFDGDYYYNACRTPLRIALDYLVSGDIRAKNAVQKMNTWIRAKTGNDPSAIHAGYYLNGNDIPGNDYESAAFAGPFAVAAMVDPSNQDWLNNAFNFLLTLDLQDYEYYDNTLNLLCMLVLSGNYWVPQGGPGGMNDGLSAVNSEVYPNPFSSSITLSIPDLNSKPVTLTVIDVFGKIVYYSAEDNSDISYSKLVELDFLPEGIYFLCLRIDEQHIRLKIMKQ